MQQSDQSGTNQKEASITTIDHDDFILADELLLKYQEKETTFGSQHDDIKSGESKFKTYSFEQPVKNAHDTKKLLDFWEFLNASNLKPVRAYKVEPDNKSEKCESPTCVCKNEPEFNWTDALRLLKEKQLHKVALATKSVGTCKLCEYENEKSQIDNYAIDDTFDMNLLNDWDPQRKFYADKEVQTDPILTEDKECQTDFLSDEDERLDRIARAMASLENLLLRLQDEYGFGPCPSCTCTPPRRSLQGIDKCTCSCGRDYCLCSKCDQVMIAIEKSNDEFERLSEFEIQSCPCSYVACHCLKDYELLLETKMNITKMLAVKFGKDTTIKYPIRCKCSCNQMNCACKILINLFYEIDQIMQSDTYIQELRHTCMCEEICNCSEYYRDVLEHKLREWDKPLIQVVCSPAHECSCTTFSDEGDEWEWDSSQNSKHGIAGVRIDAAVDASARKQYRKTKFTKLPEPTGKKRKPKKRRNPCLSLAAAKLRQVRRMRKYVNQPMVKERPKPEQVPDPNILCRQAIVYPDSKQVKPLLSNKKSGQLQISKEKKSIKMHTENDTDQRVSIVEFQLPKSKTTSNTTSNYDEATSDPKYYESVYDETDVCIDEKIVTEFEKYHSHQKLSVSLIPQTSVSNRASNRTSTVVSTTESVKSDILKCIDVKCHKKVKKCKNTTKKCFKSTENTK